MQNIKYRKNTRLEIHSHYKHKTHKITKKQKITHKKRHQKCLAIESIEEIEINHMNRTRRAKENK